MAGGLATRARGTHLNATRRQASLFEERQRKATSPSEVRMSPAGFADRVVNCYTGQPRVCSWRRRGADLMGTTHGTYTVPTRYPMPGLTVPARSLLNIPRHASEMGRHGSVENEARVRTVPSEITSFRPVCTGTRMSGPVPARLLREDFSTFYSTSRSASPPVV